LFIVDIYTQMRQLELTASQVEFSSIWLDRSERYYSYLVATRREPGLATYVGLLARIERLLGFMSNPTDHALVATQQALRSYIDRRCVIDRRRQGSRKSMNSGR
jgi:hypothetical protein